ncbi:hypothetical protein [Streptomyces sp. Y1]|uniref:Uncharacterized protein n=1 Tax=Streptomyces sp. Y1 TaxID=3238634 RepID=A0AB39THI2_9ACTN
MGNSTFWVLMPMPAAGVERFAPRLRPPVAEHAADPRTREWWRRWAADPNGEQAFHAFHERAFDGPLDEHVDVVYEAWELGQATGPYVHLAARKGSPMAGLAYAIGPERFARLPGWFGDFLLTPEQARAALPAVEAAFDLDGAARATAVERLVEALPECWDGPERILDEVLPVWRAAVEAGHGLFGTQVTPT